MITISITEGKTNYQFETKCQNTKESIWRAVRKEVKNGKLLESFSYMLCNAKINATLSGKTVATGYIDYNVFSGHGTIEIKKCYN